MIGCERRERVKFGLFEGNIVVLEWVNVPANAFNLFCVVELDVLGSMTVPAS